MPGRHHPGPRYQLTDDAMTWIAARGKNYQYGPQNRPNIDQIAKDAGTTGATLGKIIKGRLPLSAEVMAGLVRASRAPRLVAEKAMFTIVDDLGADLDADRDLVEAI